MLDRLLSNTQTCKKNTDTLVHLFFNTKRIYHLYYKMISFKFVGVTMTFSFDKVKSYSMLVRKSFALNFAKPGSLKVWQTLVCCIFSMQGKVCFASRQKGSNEWKLAEGDRCKRNSGVPMSPLILKWHWSFQWMTKEKKKSKELSLMRTITAIYFWGDKAQHCMGGEDSLPLILTWPFLGI